MLSAVNKKSNGYYVEVVMRHFGNRQKRIVFFNTVMQRITQVVCCMRVLRIHNEFEVGGTGDAPMEHLADFCEDLLVLRWEFHLGYVPGSL